MSQSVPEFVSYKGQGPYKVLSVARKGKRQLMLSIASTKYNSKPKWVDSRHCEVVEKKEVQKENKEANVIIAPSKETYRQYGNLIRTPKLNWFQRTAVKLQNLWYGKK